MPSQRNPDGAGKGGVGRNLISAALAIHLAAIFVAPMTASIEMAAERAPPGIRPRERPIPWLAVVLQPYLDIAYLNHGYNFFAPDPGPSTVIFYRAERSDGETVEGRFPDVRVHWPRLRYHRHFMLAEQLSLNPRGLGEAYIRHLADVLDARYVEMEARAHLLLTPAELWEHEDPRDPSRMLPPRRPDGPSTYSPIWRWKFEAGRDIQFEEVTEEELSP